MVPKHPLLLAAALAIIWQGPAYANSIRSNADPSDEDPSDFTPFRLGDSDEVMPKANFRLPPPKDVDGGMTDDSEDYVDSDYSGTFRDPLGISLGLKHNSDKPSQDEAKIAPTEEDPAIPARRLPVSASEKPPATPEIITPKQLDKENTNPSAPEFVPDGRAIVLENQPAESNEKPPIPPPSSEPSPTVEPPQSPASDPTPPTAKSVDVITPQPAVIASAAADGGQVAPPEPTPVESHTTSSDKGAKNTWIAVIGIIVSVGLCVCVGGLLFCLRRQRVKKSEAMKNGSFLRTSIQARSSTPGGTLNVKSPPKPSAFVVSLPSPTEAVFLDRGGEHDLFAHDTTPSDAALRPHASFSTEAISPNTARKRPSQSLSPRQMGEQQQPLRRSSSGINLNKKGLSAQGSGMIRSNSIEFGQMSPSGATGRKDRWQNIDLAPDQQSTPEDSPRQGVGLDEIDI